MKNGKIILLKGLIASGKTTRAKEQVIKGNGNVKRVNKDDLRSMIDNSKWSKGNEKGIIIVRNLMVGQYVSEGKTVIVDDTNYAPFHETVLREIADEFGAKFEIKEFDTDVDTCILRDSKRDNPVGKQVILDMYHKYVCEDVVPNDKGNTVIFDIDGTIARMDGRSPYDYTAVKTDLVVPQVREILNMFSHAYNIVICSGRNSVCRKDTEERLADNEIEYEALYMRAEDDNRNDTIVKQEMLDKIGKDNVYCVFDDRNRVVRMWRKNGLFVFHVGSGREF